MTVRNSPSQAKTHDIPTYPGAPASPTRTNTHTKMSEAVIGTPYRKTSNRAQSLYTFGRITTDLRAMRLQPAVQRHNLRLALTD